MACGRTLANRNLDVVRVRRIQEGQPRLSAKNVRAAAVHTTTRGAQSSGSSRERRTLASPPPTVFGLCSCNNHLLRCAFPRSRACLIPIGKLPSESIAPEDRGSQVLIAALLEALFGS